MLTVLRLTSGAMTELGVERRITAELVLDLAAVAGRVVLYVKLVIVLMNAVRWACLPVMDTLYRLASLMR